MNGDILMYFDQKPHELDLYCALEEAILLRWPDTAVTVHKTQVSFRCRRIFACVSLPLRRKKGWPPQCILLTFGTSAPIQSPRIAAASPVSARRWTQHVLIAYPREIDPELIAWLDEAHRLADRPDRKLP